MNVKSCSEFARFYVGRINFAKGNFVKVHSTICFVLNTYMARTIFEIALA